jgi:hypothetical protein
MLASARARVMLCGCMVDTLVRAGNRAPTARQQATIGRA